MRKRRVLWILAGGATVSGLAGLGEVISVIGIVLLGAMLLLNPWLDLW